MALNDHLYNRIQPQISRIDGRIDTISNRVGTLETITNITHVTEIVNNVISADLSTKADVDHKHVTSDITDFQSSLDDKANISDIEKLDKKLDSKSNIDHSHSIDDVNGLKNKLEKKAEISVVANLSEIVSRKANSNHIHSISDVEGLSTKIKSLEDDISGKADSVHTHSISEISELQSTLSSKSDKSYVDSELEKKYTIDYIPTIAQPDISEVTVENTGENTDAEILYFTITIIFIDEKYIPQFPTESLELCSFDINYTKSETSYTITPVINIQKIDEINNITPTLINITDFDLQSGKLIINFTYSEDSTTLTFTNISNISYQSSALLPYTYNVKNIDCDLIKNTDIIGKTQNQTASKNETTFTGNITADTFNGYNLGMNHRFYDIPSIPVIGTDLGMEVGRFIDFHKDTNTSTDNVARIFFNHTAFHISNSTILDTGDIKARNCISKSGDLENIISRTKNIEDTLPSKADINHTHNLSDITDLTDTLENKLTAPLSSTPTVKSCKAIYNSADSSAYKLHFDITFTFTDSSYIACFNTSVSDKSIFTLSFNYTQSSSSSTYTTTLYIRSTTNDAYEIYTNETDNITIAGYTINPGTLKFNLIFSISSDTSITYNNISAFTYNDTIFTTYRKFDGILLADNISPNINERINNKADKSHQHFTKDVVGLPEVLSAVSWTGHTHTISEVDGLSAKFDEMKLAIISAIYPVGSVYYSVNNTSPATLFGIGTWQHLPSSKYTRITDSSSDVSSISTGGSDNITVNNLPAHYHTTTTYDCIGSGEINSDGIFQIQQGMNQCIKEDVATVMGGTLSGDGATCKTIVHSGTEQGAYEIGVTFREKAPTSVASISQPQGIPNSSICYGRYQIPTGLAGNSDAFYPSYVELHAWVRTA